MSSYNYNQFEQMTREEKDRLCDENDQIIQEMIHRRTERERIFDYNIRRNNYDDDSNRNQLKRQLTSTSQVDEYCVHEADDTNPFIFVSRGAKRKPKNLNDKAYDGNKDDVIPVFDHTTSSATHNGGRLFINNGNLTCYTRHIELFVYLSEPSNYPTIINDTEILPSRPKHLPPQNTIILKYIPNYITHDEIYKELSSHFGTLYNVEEMKGSKTDKFRHVRMELKSNSEYEGLLRSGGLSIGGHLIEAEEFLAPPRLLMCTKCNEPGHIRKYCAINSTYQLTTSANI
ncbi:unnamed protein product [Rotaria sordida]|uniref:CCHC-type domain-containing protein n=2 Tax=Rotaria sordida TaxID=392033 RepID=A0A813PQT8_9BILA|nr:unnamed protein product [Rotaria sordida]